MALSSTLARFGRGLLAARQPLVVAASRSLSTSSVIGTAETAAEPSSERGWGSTKIADLLRAKAEKGGDNGGWLSVSKDDLVIKAVEKMTKGNVGSLLVYDPSKVSPDSDKASEDAVCGIVTERDYMTRMVIQGRSSLTTPVSEIMTPGKKLITTEPSDTVVDVMEQMVDNNIRHVPVVDKGLMVGMISMRDMVNVMVKEHRDEVGQLQEFIAGTY